jgi:excinuclease ABC subunit C
MFDLQEALKNLPDHSGVYIMKNDENQIIYIGKAVSLKNRVRQYFQNSRNHSEKVRAMVSHISEFEYILTDTELEALILECNLIKKHRPKYNILLKDDKHYPYIKITMNEEYPRIIVTRRILKDGAKYFGPYSDSSAVNETIQIVKKLYPLRSCSKVFPLEVFQTGHALIII